MIYVKFDWNWPAGSGEDFLKIFSVFLLFCDYLPLEKDNPLYLNNLESPRNTEYGSSKTPYAIYLRMRELCGQEFTTDLGVL